MPTGFRLVLVAFGAALLISSVGVAGYSRLAEWQHGEHVRASAPPAEVLPERLAYPRQRSVEHALNP
jgi:hypothetical protein